ncbi:Sec-independent protein translocase protein TatB [Sphingomonas sp.]|uniref:Sec-independent protein translocase protein TatB n=1 Tax=Sphingomonas sp. TaxID=28214 RepID=UPI0035B05ECD
MFDIAPTEFMLVAFVALVVIGPKDLPKAMRVVGYWVGKARGVARQFRQGFDTMVREAELEEMEKRWAAENERIMREHPPAPPVALDEDTPASPVSLDKPSDHHGDTDAAHDDTTDRPVTVEKPHIVPAATDTPAHTRDGAPS